MNSLILKGILTTNKNLFGKNVKETRKKKSYLKRKREDFELEVKIADSRFQRDVLRLLGTEVKVVAEQLGYDLVFSNEAPGLMFLNTQLDITDKVLDRMNK